MARKLVRGVNPWPEAYTRLDGKTLKIWKAAAASPPGSTSAAPAAPATVLAASLHEGLLVACGDGGVVALLTVQTEGKKSLTAAEFLRGRAVGPGQVLR